MFRTARAMRLIGLVTLSIYCTACVATSGRSVKSVSPQASQSLRTVDVVLLKPPLISGTEGSSGSSSGTGSPGYTYYNTPSGGGGGGGALVGAALAAGLIGVIVVAEVMKRQREQQRKAALLQANLGALDVETAMERAIRANFTNLEWFRDPNISRKNGKPEWVIANAAGESDADAVAFVTPAYEFNDDFSKISVSLQYTMYPVASGLRQAQGVEPGEHAPVLNTQVAWEVSIPEEKHGPAEANLNYWKADDGKAAREALDTAVRLASAKLYAALTDPQATLTAETISVPREPARKKENIFPSIAARNDWYRQQIDTVTMTWPIGIFGITRTCEDIDLVDECRGMMESAAAAVQQKRERLLEACEAADVVPVTPSGKSPDTTTCRNLYEPVETQIAATPGAANDNAKPEPEATMRGPVAALPRQKTYDEIYGDLKRDLERKKQLADGSIFQGRNGDSTLRIVAAGNGYDVTVNSGAAAGHETVRCTGVLHNPSTNRLIASCVGAQLGPRSLVGTFPELILTTERGYNNYNNHTSQSELSFSMTPDLTEVERKALEQQAREAFAALPGQGTATPGSVAGVSRPKTYDEVLSELKRVFVRERRLSEGGTFLGQDGDTRLRIVASGSHIAINLNAGETEDFESVRCNGVLHNPSTRKLIANCAGIRLGTRTLSGIFPQLELSTDRTRPNYIVYSDRNELSFEMEYQLTPADLAALEQQARDQTAAGDKTAFATVN